jgi:hypothetical protein
MKRIVLIITLSCFGLSSNAQDHDSTLYRRNNVKTVNLWTHIVGFETTRDTCLSTVKKIDKNGNPTYIKMDYRCQGWDVVNELNYTYDENNNVVGLTTLQNNVVISDLSMTVDSFGRILTEKNTFFDPPGMVQVKNLYFGEGQYTDSMYSVEVDGTDTTYLFSTYTFANNQLVKSSTINALTNKPVNSLNNRYDAKGRLIRAEFIYFLGYDNDDITKFEYNEKDQISKTVSELTDLAAEFFYTSDGLPAKSFYYNKFGTLEREIWYKYEYYE